jgi:AcrR family transcriptional regulator
MNNSVTPSTKTDRRVLRTRVALRDAFHALISEKGYDAITVEEITQRAGLGRATFYLHYKDKEDLLLDRLNELAQNRVQLLDEIPISGWDIKTNPPYLPILLVFQNAAENASLYRVVLHSEGSARITARLRDIICSALETIQVQGSEGGFSLTTTVPVDFLASYLAGALVGTISWWLDQDGANDPVEMTRTFQLMFFPGAAQMFGFSIL